MAVTANSLITPQGVRTVVKTASEAKPSKITNTNVVKIISQDMVPNGALIKRCYAIPRGNVAAALQCHLYRSYDFGSTLFFADSVTMPAYAGTAGVAVPKADFGATNDDPIRLNPTEELFIAIDTASTSGIDFVIEFEAF
jgi:hypothetical protein